MNSISKKICFYVAPMFWMISIAPAGAEEAADRWYTEVQTKAGRSLYAMHCAECHGENGESSQWWNKPGQDGFYPPPPLDGTGHTWHHQLPLLRRIIREGGTKTGGRMPAFDNKLSTEEIDALIASFQSLWPEDIYRKWTGEAFNRVSQPKIIQELLRELE